MQAKEMDKQKIPSSFSIEERNCVEMDIVKQFLLVNEHFIINQLVELVPISKRQELKSAIDLTFGELHKSQSTQQLLKYEQQILDVLHCFNYYYRLKLKDRSNYKELIEFQHQNCQPMNLLQVQTPCEYVNESIWEQGSPAQQEEAWVGHGYFWKFGKNAIDKDNKFTDFDAIEPNYIFLKAASVALADYDLLRRDFADYLKGKSEQEINLWLLEQAAYLSEGQYKRISKGGDQEGLYERVDDTVLDFGKRKSGIRARGAGRATTFLVDNQYSFKNNQFTAGMIDVKGCGTSIFATKIQDKKASGLLSQVDALKEISYQRLLQRIAEKEKQKWGTIQYYAIIDTGIKFKDSIENPATGYKGERLVFVLRQMNSRLVSSYDTIVYYSVVEDNKLEHNENCKNFMKCMLKYGITTEQDPQVVYELAKHNFKGKYQDIVNEKLQEELANNLKGFWNLQADASLTHFVDYSQFYVLPWSQLPSIFRMSEVGLRKGFQAGGTYFQKVLKDQDLAKYIYGHDMSQNQADVISKVHKLLEKEFKGVGKFKPPNSWSWFLETDDSEIMNWCFKVGLNPQPLTTQQKLLQQIDSWINQIFQL